VPHTKFKDYRPDGLSSSRSAAGGTDDKTETEEDMTNVDGFDGVDGIDRRDEAVRANSFSEGAFNRNTSPRRRKNRRTDGTSEGQSAIVSSSEGPILAKLAVLCSPIQEHNGWRVGGEFATVAHPGRLARGLLAGAYPPGYAAGKFAFT
jgi:hypothetical protein